MARKRVVRASRFLARSECPVCAPLRRSLVLVNAIRVGKILSRGPVPDMLIAYGLDRKVQWNERGLALRSMVDESSSIDARKIQATSALAARPSA